MGPGRVDVAAAGLGPTWLARGTRVRKLGPSLRLPPELEQRGEGSKKISDAPPAQNGSHFSPRELVQLEYHSSPAIRGLSRVDHTGHKNREAAPANVIGESLPAGSEGPWKIQVFNQPGGC